MKTGNSDFAYALLAPEAVRERCHEIFMMAEASKLKHFEVHLENLNDAVELVLKEIKVNYPNTNVPFHSRWRHFQFGHRNLWFELAECLSTVSSVENARRRFDLAIVSVLLDAGAGPDWQYNDKKTGIVQGRSEGLALASIRLLESGLLSLNGEDEPFRVDAEALKKLNAKKLGEAFQVSAANPLLGLDNRASLLNRLGAALLEKHEMFGRDGTFRPGNLFDYLSKKKVKGTVEARDILIALLHGFGSIWPDGEWLGNIPIGDVGYHSSLSRKDITNRMIPFHKLSQWMTYSLIEPLEEAGVKVINLDNLTGLPEYRNGGLFLDTKVLKVSNAQDLITLHQLKSSLVVEWRALTVALLDKLAEEVRRRTGNDATSLPLASVLQGGTWSAGRRIASQLRKGGTPPLSLQSSGTIF